MKVYDQPELQKVHEAIYTTGRKAPIKVLPPGTSQQAFEEILERLRSAVGKENVIVGDDLINFVDPFSPSQDHIPSAAVCPSSVSDIQAVLTVANKYRVPLWTCSRGKNLGYGGSAPRVNGSIVLSLHRMSQILEVSEKGAFAVVEPGVTFLDLSQYCVSKAPSVWPSVPSIGWGSVVGNTLDRGFGYNMLGDHHHSICGMEVVLANGDVVRTGQWAANGSPTAHLCKNSLGPQIDGLFMQSNLGIVTKLAVWLQPRPQCYMSIVVTVERFDDLSSLIDTLAELRREDILQNHPLIGDVLGGLSAIKTAAELFPGEGTIPEMIIEKLRVEGGMGRWTAIFDFYGPKEMVLVRLSRTQKAFKANLPTAKVNHTFFEGSAANPLNASEIAKVVRGEPVGVVGSSRASMINFALPPGGGGHGGHRDFASILPIDGKMVLEWLIQARKILTENGFNPILGMRVFQKHCVVLPMVFYDSENAHHVQRLPIVWEALVQKAKELRLTNYRAHLENMDSLQGVFDFNGQAYKRFVETLKDQLDPNGILSPGKQGIWPKQWPKQKL